MNAATGERAGLRGGESCSTPNTDRVFDLGLPPPKHAPEAANIKERGRLARAHAAAAAVCDPEIPSLTLEDLGVLRSVVLDADTVVVTIVPTYTGCPATEAIRDDLRAALTQADVGSFAIHIALAPAWRSDWITPVGCEKLRAAGIAPPACGASLSAGLEAPLRFLARAANAVACPRCGSLHTDTVSEYGSTACKALYRCLACAEPFDYFKPY